ncbi:MAG: hypothetical protein ABIR68_17500, partial [Ilumatobacteraceae bacterium]
MLVDDHHTRPGYLSGIYEPIGSEVEVAGLDVIGRIPDGLDGQFVQNGPNPAVAPGIGHSW